MTLNLNLKFVYYHRLSPFFLENLEVVDKNGTTKIHRSCIDYVYSKLTGIDFSRGPVEYVPQEFARQKRQFQPNQYMQHITAWLNKTNYEPILSHTRDLPFRLYTGNQMFDEIYVKLLTDRRINSFEPDIVQVLGQKIISRKFVESKIGEIIAETLNKNMFVSQPQDELWHKTISFWLHPRRNMVMDHIDNDSVYFSNGYKVVKNEAVWRNFLISETRQFEAQVAFRDVLRNVVARVGELFAKILKIGDTEMTEIETFKMCVKILTLKNVDYIEDEIEFDDEFDLWAKYATEHALPHLVQWFATLPPIQ